MNEDKDAAAPDPLPPHLARQLPPGTRVVAAVVVRRVQAPNGQLGVHVEHPPGAAAEAIALLAKGIEAVLQSAAQAAAQAAGPSIQTPGAELAAELLRRRNGGPLR